MDKKNLLKYFLLLPLCFTFLHGCNEVSSSSNVGNNNSLMPDIEDYEVSSLSIITNPTKMVYDVGEVFDYTGIRLKAVWNDGEEEEFGGYRCDKIEPLTPLTSEDTKITFTYWNATVDLPITVQSRAVTSLSVDTSAISTKMVYGNFVDLSQIKVSATYNDGTTDEVTSYSLLENDVVIDNITRHEVTLGEHEIFVKYLNVTTSFTLTGFDGIYAKFGKNSVGEATLEATSELPFFVETADMVDSFKEGKDPDTGRTVWIASNENEYTATDDKGIHDIKALANIRIHIYSHKASYAKISLNAGGYNITRPDIGSTSDMDLSKCTTVKVNGQDVNVKESILPANNKNGVFFSQKWTPYFVDVDYIDTFLKEGDNVIEISVNETYYKTDPFQNQRYGEVYFSIKSLSAEYVEGQKQVTSLKVEKMPNKTTYNVGDIFDPTGMKVMANFDDFTTSEVINYSYSKTPLTAEDTKVTLYYLNASVDVPITVSHEHDYIAKKDATKHYEECSLCGEIRNEQNHILGDLRIETMPKVDYMENETLSLDGLKVTSTCSSCGEVDVTSLIEASSNSLSLLDKNAQVETKQITLSYLEKSLTYNIKVHKTYSVYCGNRQDPNNTTEKYYLEKAVKMENGQYEYGGSGTLNEVKTGATLSFHVYSEIEGNVSIILNAGSLCCNGKKNAEEFYLETTDMLVEKTLSIKVKNGDADYQSYASKDGAVIKGHKLPDNYEELGITSKSYCMNLLSLSVVAENIPLVVGDNIIELTVLETKGIYSNAWGSAATLNIKDLYTVFGGNN